jgi:hypothetical protein
MSFASDWEFPISCVANVWHNRAPGCNIILFYFVGTKWKSLHCKGVILHGDIGCILFIEKQPNTSSSHCTQYTNCDLLFVFPKIKNKNATCSALLVSAASGSLQTQVHARLCVLLSRWHSATLSCQCSWSFGALQALVLEVAPQHFPCFAMLISFNNTTLHSGIPRGTGVALGYCPSSITFFSPLQGSPSSTVATRVTSQSYFLL